MATLTRYGLALLLGICATAWLADRPSALLAADEEPGHTHAGGEDGENGHDHGDGSGHDHDGEGSGGDGGHGASHAGHSGPASNHPLSIDPDLAIVTLIVFVLLLIVLTKFAWKPIMAGLAKREQGIADDIEGAAARRQEAEKLLADYQQQLEEAGGKVREMLDGAKKEAEEMKQSILDEASKAAAAEKDRATREIEAAKNSAIGEIAQHSVNIAFRVASDAVRREVKPDDHRNLIEDALKQFPSEN